MKTNQFTNLSFNKGNALYLNRTTTLRYLATTTLILVLFLLIGCGGGLSEVSVPADAQETCTVTTTEFASWFETGTVALDGVVNPADSVNFPDIPNCSFYQWSEQMFLWLTSPTPPHYGGGGGRIFNSPAFFDVSPPDSNGDRTLIPLTLGQLRLFDLRAAQVGPLALPIIFDIEGRMFSVEPPVFAQSGNQLILDASGEPVEIGSARIGEEGIPIFFDPAGKEIPRPRPIIRPEFIEEPIVQKFIIDDKLEIFLNVQGTVVSTEQGQAGGGDVLMAQNGSLVYFATTVNDVFAYFLTGIKTSAIPSPGGNIDNALFPTTQAELDDIIDFAADRGVTLVDPEALAIEVKTSWIEADELDDPSDFITIQATIPTYDTSNPNEWVPNGQKTVELAMVGMHVVGSTKGHPEMLWATFEHVSSTPNAAYSYNSTSGLQNVAQNTDGNWLFSVDGAAAPFNQAHMRVNSSGNIEAVSPHTISPSNTIRWKPWGKPTGSASSNTELISINNSVRGMLVSGDVRHNYIQTGTTWTIFGAPPSSTNQVGTNFLANTTMETYQQGTSTAANGTNCFTCHTTNTVRVSHMFCNHGFDCDSGLQPLEE